MAIDESSLCRPTFVLNTKLYFSLSFSQEQQIVPVTFLTTDAHVKLKGYEALESLTVSFEFRTFEEDGVLMYHKFYSDGYVKVSFSRYIQL